MRALAALLLVGAILVVFVLASAPKPTEHYSVCGNGVVESGEECDPPGPECSEACKVQALGAGRPDGPQPDGFIGSIAGAISSAARAVGSAVASGGRAAVGAVEAAARATPSVAGVVGGAAASAASAVGSAATDAATTGLPKVASAVAEACPEAEEVCPILVAAANAVHGPVAGGRGEVPADAAANTANVPANAQAAVTTGLPRCLLAICITSVDPAKGIPAITVGDTAPVVTTAAPPTLIGGMPITGLVGGTTAPRAADAVDEDNKKKDEL